MFDFLAGMMKYLTVSIVTIYAFISYMLFICKKQVVTKADRERLSKVELLKLKDKYNREYKFKKKLMFLSQYGLIMVLHILNYIVLIARFDEPKYVVLGSLELIFMVAITKIYRVVYSGISRLLFNNMLFLMDIGFIMLCRLNFEGAKKQFIIIVCSSLFCLIIPKIIAKIGYLDKYNYKYGLFGMALLIIVLFFGTTNFGATNWLKIGNITFQPSEIVKIMFVFCMASLISKYKDDLKNLGYVTLFAFAFVFLLALEKDLGAALIFFITYFVMLYVATKKKIYILIGALLGSLAAFVAYQLPNFRHVRVRVAAWKDPFADIEVTGYQITQSLFAIATGKWFGLGLTNGMPKTIPVHISDFIFSAICEEMGCIVGIMIILIYINCFVMFINIAMLLNRLFYKMIAAGLSMVFITQVFLTIGGAIKFIPSTGVTLPLISYGGSSMLSTLIIFNVVQGMYVRREYLHKNNKTKTKQKVSI